MMGGADTKSTTAKKREEPSFGPLDGALDLIREIRSHFFHLSQMK